MCKYRYKLKPIKGVDTSELYLNYYNGKFELLDISEQFGYTTAFEKMIVELRLVMLIYQSLM